MRKAIAAAVVAASVTTSACGHHGNGNPGPITDRSFEVGGFDRLELAGAYDATVRTGAAPSVHARGGQNLLDQLVVEVKNGTLEIHPKEHHGFFHWGWGSHNSKIVLTITVPGLRAAELAGSGGIRIDRVTGDSFEGSVAGSGDLNLDRVEVANLKLGIAGSGDAKAVAGTARNAKYEIAGSGGID